MAILNNSNAISTTGGYDINNSLRFRSSASAYLGRTPASASNRKTWTWSAWVKRGALGARQTLFSDISGTTDSTFIFMGFTTADNLEISAYNVQFRTSTQVFRDPSAWYHIVFVADTNNATAQNRLRIYVNNNEITSFSTNNAVTQNSDLGINQNTAHFIASAASAYLPFDGYLADVNFIDGQALTPSSFGETDTTTGVWKPKAYTGTYGTNGFYLKFSDIATTSGSNAGLGKDFSGNANYWTTNNISVTAGTTYDAMIDSPTLTSATVANYSVANPLSTLFTVTAGNMDFTYTNSTSGVWYLKGTLAVSSDKYYWEVTPTNVGAGQNISIGIVLSTNTQTNTTTTNLVTDGYVYHCDGNKYSGSSGSVAYGATYTNNDVIGVALDLTAGTLVFYKNNVSQGTAFTGLTSSYMQLICNHLGGISRTVAGSVNAGQRPFTYTPPSGFVALNTFNLPDSTIKKGSSYMDATLYSGTGTTQTITNVSGFKPDLVWTKCRSFAYNHKLWDSVRGVTKSIDSNAADAESTVANGLTAFNSNGMTLGGDAGTNTSSQTYVGWQWQAGQGTTSSNTSGTITSTVSVNATAGFSIVTYTGTGANATVGHGLGVAPKMLIVKNRSVASAWRVWFTGFAGTELINLNETGGKETGQLTTWNSTVPTSTVFSLGTAAAINGNGNSLVAYLWSEIAGFSKFGSYVGNFNADGPFIYTGFRPKFVLLKASGDTGNWNLLDGTRNPSNVANARLRPNISDAEVTTTFVDFLSNGFKIRTSDSDINYTVTNIYMAFAENPFKNANAR